jgi:hypothetical protein
MPGLKFFYVPCLQMATTPSRFVEVTSWPSRKEQKLPINNPNRRHHQALDLNGFQQARTKQEAVEPSGHVGAMYQR